MPSWNIFHTGKTGAKDFARLRGVNGRREGRSRSGE